MKNMIENGVYAAAATPLHKDLSCNIKLLTDHCQDLIKRGVKGVVLFGTTGEGASFSLEERKQVLKSVIDHGLDPRKIILGNGSSSIPETIELIRAASESGCLASLVGPPSYFKNISEEGVLAYYREIIRHTSHQIILYHIPQNTGVPITATIAKTLFQEFPGSLAGLKESEGNPALVSEILQAIPHCKVFVGKEKQIPEALKAGAAGSISGMANLIPEVICSVYETGDTAELDKMALPLKKYPFIPACKAMLSKQNPEWQYIRPPLSPMTFQ